MPFRAEQVAMRIVLLLAVVLFAAGLVMPIATIEQFFILGSTFSVLSGLMELLEGNQLGLFILVFAFSILLPIVKIGVLFRVVYSGRMSSDRVKHCIHLIHQFGRWSMLDVLVVAMLVVAVKITAVADIETHLGLYLFSAGVLSIMAITSRVIGWDKDE